LSIALSTGTKSASSSALAAAEVRMPLVARTTIALWPAASSAPSTMKPIISFLAVPDSTSRQWEP
jgi:hypothetical protein